MSSEALAVVVGVALIVGAIRVFWVRREDEVATRRLACDEIVTQAGSFFSVPP
jgi:hypothetical protein